MINNESFIQLTPNYSEDLLLIVNLNFVIGSLLSQRLSLSNSLIRSIAKLIKTFIY